MSRRQPIEDLLADPATPAHLRQRLQTVQNIRRYASEVLALPDNGSYRSYADLERDAATWLVAAAPALSLEPMRWCYLFVGCLSYRGYFKQAHAQQLASQLTEQGYETTVVPSAAYSTLGRFADPVLNTMIDYDDVQLAGLLFHELAHQVIYLPGDTMFNESFATAVEQIGRQQWAQANRLVANFGPVQKERERRFNQRLLQTRAELIKIFEQAQPAPQKRRQKQTALAKLRDDYQVMKSEWGGYSGFDHWFADGGPNNARFALLATYELKVPAFSKLFYQQQANWPAFYRAVIELGKLPPVERNTRLQQLETSDQN